MSCYKADFEPKIAALEEPEGKDALPRGLDFLTSGMFFDEVQNWFWVAASENIKISLTARLCLSRRFRPHDPQGDCA